MALAAPIDTAVEAVSNKFHNGPFYYNGYRYVLGVDYSNNAIIEIWKSSNGSSWSQTGGDWTTTGTVRSLWGFLQDGVIHVTAINLAGDLFYRPFNCSTDSWGTATTLDSDVMFKRLGCSIALRSNGNIIVAFEDDLVKITGKNYGSISLYVYTTSWNKVTVETASSSYDWGTPIVVRGASDNVYIFYQDYLNRNVYVRQYTSGGSLGSRKQVNSSSVGDGTANCALIGATYHSEGSNEVITMFWVNSSGYPTCSRMVNNGTPGTNTTITSSVIASDGNVEYYRHASVATYAQTVCLIYVPTSDYDLYFTKSTGGGSWTTPTVIYASITGEQSSCNVYQVSGYYKLFYTIEVGDNDDYDEYTIESAGVTVSAGYGAAGLNGLSGTLIKGAVSVSATARSVVLTGLSAGISSALPPVTIYASADSLTVSGQNATVTPGSVTVTAASGTAAFGGQPSDVVPGAITVPADMATAITGGSPAAIIPGTVAIHATAGAPAFSATAADIVPGSIAVIITSGQLVSSAPAGIITGSVTIHITANSVDFTGYQADIIPGPVDVMIDGGMITLNMPGATITPGGITVSVSAGSTTITGLTAPVIVELFIYVTYEELTLSGPRAMRGFVRNLGTLDHWLSASVLLSGVDTVSDRGLSAFSAWISASITLWEYTYSPVGAISIGVTSHTLTITGSGAQLYSAAVIVAVGGTVSISAFASVILPGAVTVEGQYTQLLFDPLSALVKTGGITVVTGPVTTQLITAGADIIAGSVTVSVIYRELPISGINATIIPGQIAVSLNYVELSVISSSSLIIPGAISVAGQNAVMVFSSPGMMLVPGGIAVDIQSASAVLFAQNGAVIPGGIAVDIQSASAVLFAQNGAVIPGGIAVNIQSASAVLFAQNGAVIPGGVNINGQIVTILSDTPAATLIAGSVTLLTACGIMTIVGTVAAAGGAIIIYALYSAATLYGNAAAVIPGAVIIYTDSTGITVISQTASVYSTVYILTGSAALSLTGLADIYTRVLITTTAVTVVLAGEGSLIVTGAVAVLAGYGSLIFSGYAAGVESGVVIPTGYITTALSAQSGLIVAGAVTVITGSVTILLYGAGTVINTSVTIYITYGILLQEGITAVIYSRFSVHVTVALMVIYSQRVTIIPGGVAVLAGYRSLNLLAAIPQIRIGLFGFPGRIVITCLAIGDITLDFYELGQLILLFDRLGKNEMEFVPVRWLNDR